MKLRSVTLGNVRRFGGREAHLGPFGDGLTTICAPNEAGKSTFFDALHALFFASHTSAAAEVKSLRPHAGGAVRVAAEIEIDARRYRVEKSFLGGKSAQVVETASGRVLGRAGEAEDWIRANIQSRAIGPAGLLWVRQGMTGFGPDGGSQRDKAERDRLREARQELMSSVAGQIDAVTGGRRMDAIMRCCQAELDRLATAGLKPKAGGPWAAQEAVARALSQDCHRLKGLVRDLGEALGEKRRLRGDLARISDPAETARRADQIAAARDAVRIANDHARDIATADRELGLLDREAQQVADTLDGIAQVRARRRKRDERIATLAAALDAAKAALGSAKDAALAAGAAQDDAIAVRDDLAGRLRTARRLAERRSGLDALNDLMARRKQVEDLVAALRAARKTLRDAALGPADLDAIEALERRRAQASLRREAGAARFVFDYAGSSRAEIDGVPVPEGEARIVLAETKVELPGFGHLTLRPGADSGVDGDDPEALGRELASRLSTFGLDGLAAARGALADVAAARTKEGSVIATIAAIAPDGVDALRARISDLAAALEVPAEGDAVPRIEESAPVEDVAGLERALDAADQALAGARTARQETEQRRGDARDAVIEAETELRVETDARQAEAAPADEAGRHAALAADHRNRLAACEAARARLADMRAASPDRAIAEAHLARLESARENAADEKARLARALHELEGRIGARAEDAVEEQLAEAEQALAKAEERSRRYRLEVDALALLRSALEDARTSARDAYFEPVKREIQPLLSVLHGGASFEMDSDDMLVGKIVRNGVEDAIDILSGGASEQIAILTRLAFARLYRKDGRHVPVILDDALVHSDDDRIATMFTLLTHVAQDQQIIVFSCRNRTFADLGGDRMTIRVTDLAE